MRIAGILCEYNPFHRGHEEQIKAVKEKTDYLICLMSGSFVQRGEPAMFYKYARAKWALTAGADAVFELPCLYALSSAEGFARGGMRLFQLLGIDTLYFGSECESDALCMLADAYEKQSPAFTKSFHQALSFGLSYAAAKAQAARLSIIGLPDRVFMPNAMLGVEYLLALRNISSNIKPVALARFGDVSASSVRSEIQRQDESVSFSSSLRASLPSFVLEDIPALYPVLPKHLSQALLYRLRTMTQADFAALPNISEGFENRLYHAARRATNYDEFLGLAAHRRMPLSRIKRTMMCALLNVDASTQALYAQQNPGYLRLLGMRSEAASLISHIKAQASVPIVTQPAHHLNDLMLTIDLRATDIHALFAHLCAGLDYTSRLITL